MNVGLLVFIILLIGLSCWGWIARAKYINDLAAKNKNKEENNSEIK